MKQSLVSTTRGTVIGVVYSIAAFALSNQMQQLDMAWLVSTTLPLALYYLLLWPHEKAELGKFFSQWFHVLGALAIFVWVTFVFGSAMASQKLPTWMADQVKIDFGIGTKAPAAAPAWELDARQLKSTENGSTWVAAMSDRRMRGTRLESATSRILSPVFEFAQKLAFVITLLLTAVCGGGLFIAAYFVSRRTS